jgi:ribosomal protein S18 acetylase RimI-like enzyme
MEMPQNHKGRDFRVVEQDGGIIGIAESSLRDQGRRKVRFFKIVVDPAARRQGIASSMLAELLAIDESTNCLSLQSLCSPEWPAGLAFLKAFGFTQRRIRTHASVLAPYGANNNDAGGHVNLSNCQA